jgi:hypothetical protein
MKVKKMVLREIKGINKIQKYVFIIIILLVGVSIYAHLPAYLLYGVITSMYLILVTLFLLELAIRLKKAKTSNNWPSTIGTIINSDIRKSYRNENVDILYEYIAGGNRYTSSEISYGYMDESISIGWSVIQSNARKAIKQYPVGKRVVVFYNPDKPEDAVLELGLSFGFFTNILFMFFVTIVLGLFLKSFLVG